MSFGDHQPLRNVGRRRGAVAVMFAVLLIPLLAFMAFCIDIGWVATTKSELQNAADSAAAAGARQLLDNYAAYSLPSQRNRSGLITSARQQARTYSARFGGYNSAGGVTSLQILSRDIQSGFTDAGGQFQAGWAGYPNTVQVLARRDSSANGRLSLFFAPVLGTRDTELTASASATVYTGLISSFDPRGGGAGTGSTFNVEEGDAWGEDYESSGESFENLLLPVAFDVNYWIQFFQTGLSPDGQLHLDAEGAPQIKVYPSPMNTPGNFGVLCIGPWTNSDAIYKDWVRNGPSASDLDALIEMEAVPVSQGSPRPWKGTPGLRSTLQRDFEAIIGQPRLLPLFKPASTSPYQGAKGHGSNATYDIVGFVGVTVTEATGRGNGLNISVTPCSVMDPTAVFAPDSLYPVGAEPPTQLRSFTHPAPKFTR